MFFILDNIPNKYKTLIGLIALALVIFIVLFIVIKSNVNKNRLINKVNKLNDRVFNANFASIDAYLSRLKNIARNNESYVSIYNSFSARIEKIKKDDRDHIGKFKKEIINRINNEKTTKGKLIALKEFENIVDNFTNNVSSISSELHDRFKVSEDYRKKIVVLQNSFQNISNDVNRYSGYLTLCLRELRNYLQKISDRFDILDSQISSANYDKASNTISIIEDSLSKLDGKIETIATYCSKITDIIPKKLFELEDRYKILENRGYIVCFSKVVDVINDVKNKLTKCQNDFKSLNFADFDETYKTIESQLEEASLALDNEVKSKDTLDEKYNSIIYKVKDATSSFLTTKRQFELMQEFYIVSDEIIKHFEMFQKNATLLSSLKSEYETYIISKTPNPASFMMDKLTKIESLTNQVLDDINYFKINFKSYKEYVEKAHKKANELLKSFALLIGTLRLSKTNIIYKNYKEKINKQISILNQMNNIIHTLPIDIDSLKEDFDNIVLDSSELIAQIEQDYSSYILLEKSIIFANPLRCQFNNVDEMVNDVEKMFLEGEYKIGQEKINDVLNNYHQEGYEAFK